MAEERKTGFVRGKDFGFDFPILTNEQLYQSTKALNDALRQNGQVSEQKVLKKTKLYIPTK